MFFWMYLSIYIYLTFSNELGLADAVFHQTLNRIHAAICTCNYSMLNSHTDLDSPFLYVSKLYATSLYRDDDCV